MLACSAQPLSDDPKAEAGFALATSAASDEDVQLQSPEDAAEEDLKLVAEANNWTIDEASAQRDAADAAGALAELVRSKRPEIFIGGALSKRPGGPPTLFVKGSADDELKELVATAPVPIVISDGHAFSLGELEQLEDLLNQALSNLGFNNFSTWFDVESPDTVQALVTLDPKLPSDPASIRRLLPESLASLTNIAVQAEPVATDHTAFGGMLDDTGPGTNVCTAGWTIISDLGPTGVLSAGHCPTQNRLVHPSLHNHVLTFRDEHRGGWGDVEWYSTNTTNEAKFYANVSIIRSNLGVKPQGSILVNESVCMFSRVQGTRNCNELVAATSVSCTVGGFSYQRLVRMNGIFGVGGDSGAAWYGTNTAYGAHKGQCGGGDVWTKADHFYDAMAVIVWIP